MIQFDFRISFKWVGSTTIGQALGNVGSHGVMKEIKSHAWEGTFECDASQSRTDGAPMGIPRLRSHTGGVEVAPLPNAGEDLEGCDPL